MGKNFNELTFRQIHTSQNPRGNTGHDKPFCTKAITLIDMIILKMLWAILIIDKAVAKVT